MENNVGKGKYFIIRSSESKEAIGCWGEPEFEEEGGRWYESCGCGFACYRDGAALQEMDDLNVETFNNEHPGIVVKETFCELVYNDSEGRTSDVEVILVERNNGKNRSFSFTIEHADKRRIDEILEGIRGWHSDGYLRIGDFISYGCCGAWRD